jgi:hypothetical protein
VQGVRAHGTGGDGRKAWRDSPTSAPWGKGRKVQATTLIQGWANKHMREWGFVFLFLFLREMGSLMWSRVWKSRTDACVGSLSL